MGRDSESQTVSSVNACSGEKHERLHATWELSRAGPVGWAAPQWHLPRLGHRTLDADEVRRDNGMAGRPADGGCRCGKQRAVRQWTELSYITLLVYYVVIGFMLCYVAAYFQSNIMLEYVLLPVQLARLKTHEYA